MKWLLKFLKLGIGISEGTAGGIRRPLGYSQILNATLASATKIVPATYAPPATSGLLPGFVIVQCQGGVVRWRDDGVAPTATIGMSIASGGELDYTGDPANLQFISSSGTPILDVSVMA